MSVQEGAQLSAVLAPPDAVVQDYLDFMLRTVTETIPTDVSLAEKVAAAPTVMTSDSVVSLTVRAEERVQEPTLTTLPVIEDAPPVTETVAGTGAQQAIALKPRAANGRPQWAQAPFECLLFQVMGLKLAAPLVELGGIARIGEDLTPIFGQSEWFLGLLRWNDRNIRVIDTAKLIMPERAGEGRHPYEFVLLIEGTDWGLGIDSATEALHLTPDEVRWRLSTQSRPWLAGTVLEKMCALLDMNTIAHTLQGESKS